MLVDRIGFMIRTLIYKNTDNKDAFGAFNNFNVGRNNFKIGFFSNIFLDKFGTVVHNIIDMNGILGQTMEVGSSFKEKFSTNATIPRFIMKCNFTSVKGWDFSFLARNFLISSISSD
jgi:hypothetical protein